MHFPYSLDRHQADTVGDEQMIREALKRNGHGPLHVAPAGQYWQLSPSADDIAAKVVELLKPIIHGLIEEHDRKKTIEQQEKEIRALIERLEAVMEAGRKAFHVENVTVETLEFLKEWSKGSTLIPDFKEPKAP